MVECSSFLCFTKTSFTLLISRDLFQRKDELSFIEEVQISTLESGKCKMIDLKRTRLVTPRQNVCACVNFGISGFHVLLDWNCGRFANESFRQRLVRQRLRSIRQRPKSPCQRPTGQFANVRYLVLTENKLLIDVCFGEN